MSSLILNFVVDNRCCICYTHGIIILSLVFVASTNHKISLSMVIKVLLSLQKTVSSDVVDRMTDTSKYTGSHKHRFDEEGKGKGLEGRDSIAKGKGMIPGSVSGQTAYVSGYKGEGKYSSSPKASPKSKAKVGTVKNPIHVFGPSWDCSNAVLEPRPYQLNFFVSQILCISFS